MEKALIVALLCLVSPLFAAEYNVDTKTSVRIPYAEDLNEEMLYYVSEWGDGTVSPSSLKRSGIHGFMEHRYAKPGTYRGRFCAVSVGGNRSDWEEFMVAVGGEEAAAGKGVARAGAQSSKPASAYWDRKSVGMAFDDLYALDRLFIEKAPGKEFPTHFIVEYTINRGKTWHKLNSAQCFFFPDPGEQQVVFSFNGVVANAVRLTATRMEPGKAVHIGGLRATGSKELLFNCSERGTGIAALNNMWHAFGSAVNEVHLEYHAWGQSKRPFEGGLSYLGNVEWMAWDSLEFSWTDSKELGELRAKWLNYTIDADGYVWASPDDPRHLFHSRHYDNNAIYINGVVHYLLQTGDKAFLDHTCSRTGKTNLEKLRLAMRYQLKQLGGANGVLTIVDPEIQGLPESKSGSYWDYFKFGHQSAFDNAEYYRSLLSMAAFERWMGDAAKAEEYGALAEKTKKTFNKLFWNEVAGRYIGWIDANGVERDFGFTFVNQHILAYGLADAARARSVLDWLDGKRMVRGDTSTGKDIYHFGMAARVNTVDMATAPGLVETWGGALDPDEEGKYGLSLQNGGAIFYTSYYDLHSRLNYQGIGSAMKRLATILREFEKDELRRVPSNHVGHTLITGVLLCFPESGLVPLFYIDGIIGIKPVAEGLRIAPNLPDGWRWAEVNSYWFSGKEYSIRVDAAVQKPQVNGNGIIVPSRGSFILDAKGGVVKEEAL